MVKLQFLFVLIHLLVGAPIVELVHKGKDAGPQTDIPIMPWKVGIFYATNAAGANITYMCTGSILGAHWILTAAHCIQTPFRNAPSANKEEEIIPPPGDGTTGVIITISYGSNNLPIFGRSRGRTFKGNKVSVEAVFNQTVFVHPDYDWFNPRTSDHDIGLIYIPKGIELRENFACTAPLDLKADATLYTLEDKFSIRVAGWGRTEPYKLIRTTAKPPKFENYLSYADIYGFSGPNCVTQFPQNDTELDGIHDGAVKQKIKTELSDVLHSLSNGGTRFCGNDLNLNEDEYRAGACKGDSGGSVDLIVERVDKSGSPLCCEFRTIGLVSKGFGCGDKKYPDIYQLLTPHDLAWINETDKIIQDKKPDEALEVLSPATTEEKQRPLGNRTTQSIATNNQERRCRCVVC